MACSHIMRSKEMENPTSKCLHDWNYMQIEKENSVETK
jgi:hypothetical protein